MTEAPGGQPRNGMAVTALCFGIVALVLSPVVVGALVGGVAVILGIVALTRPARRGMAVGGIITGALSIPMALVAGVLLAFLLPVLGQARTRARETAAMAHMRSIVSAVQFYDIEKGSMPPHLAYAAPYADMQTMLKDPRSKTPPVMFPAGADVKARAAEIDAHGDFYYAGAGLDVSSLPNPGTVVLLYDQPGTGRRRLLAFADGRVDRVVPNSDELHWLWEQTNAARRAQHLPALPPGFSGPPPAAP